MSKDKKKFIVKLLDEDKEEVTTSRKVLEDIKSKVESITKEERREGEKFFSNKNQRIARGKMIRYLREQKKISAKDFCELAGVTRSYLSNIECGVRDMNMNTLDYWLHILDGRSIIIPFSE